MVTYLPHLINLSTCIPDRPANVLIPFILYSLPSFLSIHIFPFLVFLAHWTIASLHSSSILSPSPRPSTSLFWCCHSGNLDDFREVEDFYPCIDWCFISGSSTLACNLSNGILLLLLLPLSNPANQNPPSGSTVHDMPFT